MCIYIYIYTPCIYLVGPGNVGRTPAQRKRNGNVDGNVTETLTET